MITKEDWKLGLFVFAILIPAIASSFWTNGFSLEVLEPRDSTIEVAPEIDKPNRHPSPPILEPIRRANKTIPDSSGLDQTAVAPGRNRVSIGKSESPQASRALAIAHVAISDAVHAVIGSEKPDIGVAPAEIVAAIAEAASVTVTDLFPPQAANLDAGVTRDATRVGTGGQETDSADLEHRGADVIRPLAEADSSNNAEPRAGIGLVTRIDSSKRQHPISRFLRALGAHREEGPPSS
jgi:hypothetical protein